MKLEFKHLVAYLPYEIQILSKIESQIEHFKFEKCRLKSVNMLSKCVTVIHDVGINEDEEYITDKEISNIKLILKPLSDLNNDFIHNISLKTYNKNPEKFSGKFVSYLEFIWQNTNINDKIDYYELLEEFSKDILEIANYHVLEILLKNHFDIFGLIDAKLAVDINCL